MTSTMRRTLAETMVTRMSLALTPENIAAYDALNAFSLKDETSPATVISVRTVRETLAPGSIGGSGSGGTEGGAGGGDGGGGGFGGGEGGDGGDGGAWKSP